MATLSETSGHRLTLFFLRDSESLVVFFFFFFTLKGGAIDASGTVCAHFPTEMPGVCHPGATGARLAPQGASSTWAAQAGDWPPSLWLWFPAPLFTCRGPLALSLEEPHLQGVQPDPEGTCVSDGWCSGSRWLF